MGERRQTANPALAVKGQKRGAQRARSRVVNLPAVQSRGELCVFVFVYVCVCVCVCVCGSGEEKQRTPTTQARKLRTLTKSLKSSGGRRSSGVKLLDAISSSVTSTRSLKGLLPCTMTPSNVCACLFFCEFERWRKGKKQQKEERTHHEGREKGAAQHKVHLIKGKGQFATKKNRLSRREWFKL